MTDPIPAYVAQQIETRCKPLHDRITALEKRAAELDRPQQRKGLRSWLRTLKETLNAEQLEPSAMHAKLARLSLELRNLIADRAGASPEEVAGLQQELDAIDMALQALASRVEALEHRRPAIVYSAGGSGPQGPAGPPGPQGPVANTYMPAGW